MRVQGYLEIDYLGMDSKEFYEFNQFLKKYMINYYRVHKSSREYYSCIMRDHALIEDIEIDDVLVPGLLSLLSARNPVINGLWKQDGVPFGQEIEVTIDAVTNAEYVTTTGDPVYDFDLNMHLKYTPTDKTYNYSGDIISESIVTEFRPLHNFAGWLPCKEY